MSQIMEKTLASIPKLLTQSLIGGGGSKTQQRQVPAMDVQNFMKYVQRARSKSHQAHIVNSELADIQLKLKQIDLVSSPALVRSCFTKVLYCHLLGYNVNFVAIHAVNFAQQGRGFDKRLGYLMSCLLLNPHHEMVMLMMATLLRDIKSSNMGENCIALKVAGELVDAETIPTILPEVIKKFSHQHDLVKEKAIHCFHNFYQKSPELLHSETGKLNVFLASRDPGVLMAVMNVFVTLTSENPSQFVGLGKSFLHILDQINNRGFGSSYYFHMIPLPWLQISLLKVLGNIGHIDPHLSANICPILKTLIEKTKVSVPISLAVLVESILTATKIHPNETLLQLCSRCIMKLLASDSNEDMRYQGLGLLIALSRIKPSFASQHQVAVIECLTNEDHAIQSRTTLLLHAMANRANVKAICSKLFEQMEKTKEESFRQDILIMISDLAERFSPDIHWYISVYLKILSHEVPQITQDKILGLVLRKIEDLSSPDQLVDKTTIDDLLETLFSVLEKQNYLLPEFSLVVQLFGILAPILPQEFSSERFLDVVTKCLCSPIDSTPVMNHTCMTYPPDYFSEKNKTSNFSSKDLIRLKSQCVTTVTKLVLCQCIEASSVLQWLETINYKSTIKNSFLCSDLDELEDLLSNPDELKTKSSIFIQDCSNIDFSLSFLDSLVIKDMLEGGDCYKPSYIRKSEMSNVQNSLSSVSLSDDKDSHSSLKKDDDSIMSESQASQVGRKMPNKWRDNNDDEDDDVDENEWNITGRNEYSENFVLLDSEDRNFEELSKKKKDAEELFAGLNDSNFDETDILISQSGQSNPVSNPQTKWGKSIWDDDEDDESDQNRKPSIFNVGNIGINPFGIPTKNKAKNMQWTRDSDEDERTLGNFNSNAPNEFEDTVYTSSLEAHNPPSDMPWSDHKEIVSTVKENVPSIYSNPMTNSGSQSFLLSPDGTSGSTMDALTDSDPDAGES